MTAGKMREAFEVNVFGVVTVTRACVPLLRRSPDGRIVNVSSTLGSLRALAQFDGHEPGGNVATVEVGAEIPVRLALGEGGTAGFHGEGPYAVDGRVPW